MIFNSDWFPKLDKFARFLLGLILVFSGVNYFLGILTWFDMTPDSRLFIGALIDTGYFFQLVKFIEIVAGTLFLLNRGVVLAIFIISPGIINIALFHAFLEPNGRYMAVLLVGLLGIIVAFRKQLLYSILKQ
ncbi:MAG: hypothetical protein VW397_06700 [Candidatus Margulisiibacteriota bacterium]